MSIKQLNARFAELFSGYSETEDGPFTAASAARFLGESRLVRCKDYIYEVRSDKPGRIVTTTSNWFFVLTNAAVYFPFKDVGDYPRIELDFIDSVVKSPFADRIGEPEGVPAPLIFGREGRGRFEEYKNLYYCMGDRVNIRVKAHATNNDAYRGFVLLSGVEVDVMGA